jgi:murein endopeptidase
VPKTQIKDGLMTRCRPFLKPNAVCLSLITLFTLALTTVDNPLQAMTLSVGEPFRGKLINGVPFPSQLASCKITNEDRSYTTPEVVGALLDAFKTFEKKYPDSCDVIFGDFSRKGGGRLKGHGSHQNGRDVDMGLFAAGNVPLSGFVPMNSKILDVPKTWHMIQSLINTETVEHIYLDSSIQTRLYRYALTESVDSDYLAKVFKMAGGGGAKECILQHEPGHRNHMHIRFLTRWSTLAGQLNEPDPQQNTRIEVAQQSCLPRLVSYYAKEHEKDLNQLADIFGVRPRDLCKWNGLTAGDRPKSGECLVFYKLGFEPDPVQLARWPQP